MSNFKMFDINEVRLAARLCDEPDLQFIKSGTALLKLRVANTKYFKKNDGRKGEQTVFIDVTVWGDKAEYYAEHFKKGMPVLVYAELIENTWEDKETRAKRSKIELNAQRIVPLEWNGSKPVSEECPSETPAPCVIEESIPEDDIPF